MQFFKGKLVDDASKSIDAFEIEVPNCGDDMPMEVLPDCGDDMPMEVLPDCGDQMPTIEVPEVVVPDFIEVKAEYIDMTIPMKKKSACHPIGRRKH